MGQRAGRTGMCLEVELAGLGSRLGKDYSIPLSLFCPRMLTPLLPCFLCQLQQAPQPSGSPLWPLIFFWASLLPSLSSACLILPWS